MLSLKRWEDIIKLLERDGSVDVTTLSKIFDVTSKTIRQDLTKLETMGLLERVHGGAILKQTKNAVFPIQQRKQKYLAEKQRIAHAALKHIAEGDTIILDGGSTTFELAKLMGEKKVVVITNDLNITGELLKKENITLYLTGGKLRREGVYTLLGRDAVRSMFRYHANKLFLATSALDFEQGLMVLSEEEAEIKRAMIKVAKEIVALVDYSKFNQLAFTSFTGVEKINILITDDRIPETDQSKLLGLGIKLDIV